MGPKKKLMLRSFGVKSVMLGEGLVFFILFYLCRSWGVIAGLAEEMLYIQAIALPHAF